MESSYQINKEGVENGQIMQNHGSEKTAVMSLSVCSDLEEEKNAELIMDSTTEIFVKTKDEQKEGEDRAVLVCKEKGLEVFLKEEIIEGTESFCQVSEKEKVGDGTTIVNESSPLMFLKVEFKEGTALEPQSSASCKEELLLIRLAYFFSFFMLMILSFDRE